MRHIFIATCIVMYVSGSAFGHRHTPGSDDEKKLREFVPRYFSLPASVRPKYPTTHGVFCRQLSALKLFQAALFKQGADLKSALSAANHKVKDAECAYRMDAEYTTIYLREKAPAIGKKHYFEYYRIFLRDGGWYYTSKIAPLPEIPSESGGPMDEWSPGSAD